MIAGKWRRALCVSVCPSRERCWLKPWTGAPHAAYLQDSTLLHPIYFLCLSPCFHLKAILMLSLERFLFKTYFHSNIHIFFIFDKSVLWQLKKNPFCEHAQMLDCGQDAQGYFLSGNTIWRSEYEDSVTWDFFLYLQRPHLKSCCVTKFVSSLVTMPFFLYIVFSILVTEEKENTFSL